MFFNTKYHLHKIFYRLNIFEIEHWSKRYDNRHHAIDALVVALTEQSHIQRLNSLNKELSDWLMKNKKEINITVEKGENILEAFFNLEEKRRIEIQEKIESFRRFDIPYKKFLEQAKNMLETIIISHKPKDNLIIQYNDKSKRDELKIRGQLHEATFYGKHNGQDTKTIDLSKITHNDAGKIVDPILKREIEQHRAKYETIKEAFTGEGLKTFNENRFQSKNPKKLRAPVYKVKVYYKSRDEKESSLQRLYDNNNKLSVRTGGNYLFLVMQKNSKKGLKRTFDIISLFNAAEMAKEELKNKNKDFKKVIHNYYLTKNNADKILFMLQQNDLVYLPTNDDDPVVKFKTNDEFIKWYGNESNKKCFSKNVYKVVKFTGKDCFFIPHNFAMPISIVKTLTEQQRKELKKKYGDKKIPKRELNYEEFGSFGTSTKTETNVDFVRSLIDPSYKKSPKKIQDTCIKLQIDHIGNVKLAGIV